jgi:hypothetical protein
MLLVILGILVPLFVAMGVIDFRGRRRGVRYRGVDPSTRQQNESEANIRSNGALREMRDRGLGGGGMF